jgi:hypothetical protein
VTFVQRLRWLIVLAGFCAACGTAPPLSPGGETNEEAWRRARFIEAIVNGCSAPCPSEGRCVDEWGLCWTPCAWEAQGKDPAARKSIQKAAQDHSPTSTFLVECTHPPGTVQAAFTQR